MMRQLLTFLAILTGLTAFGAPVQARVSAMDEVRVQVARDGAAACSPVQAKACAMRASIPARFSGGEVSRLRPQQAIIVAPAVVLQADRAHE